MSKRKDLWSREELILAFELYCRIPFRKTKANNSEVMNLARMIGRSPASVARKLGNFGSFDPRLQAQNISGLSHASKLDSLIWNEFHANWDELVVEADGLLKNFTQEDAPVDETVSLPTGPTEGEAIRKIRIQQSFFRQAVLSSYDEACCITGLPIKACLIASHIVPWGVCEATRTDPRNGLCLSATFDRLFDTGLITISEHYALIISPSIRDGADMVSNALVCRYHGLPIRLPQRFLPLREHLEWHRSNRFQN